MIDNRLSILALVACDASYKREFDFIARESLGSTPDSAASNEEPFPEHLLLRMKDTGFVIGAGTKAEVRFPGWKLAAVIADSSTGFQALVYQNQGTNEALIALTGTNGPNGQDWYANAHLGQTQWTVRNRDRVFDAIGALSGNDGRPLVETGMVHFAGQSLGGALAQYAAYDFVKDRLIPGGIYDPKRVSITTFNGLGAVDGLQKANPDLSGPRAFDPTLLHGVQTAHYVVRNDLVHRLGKGNLNGPGNTYMLDFRPMWGDRPAPVLLDLVEAHRIESGFYRGFANEHRLRSNFADFRIARPTAIEYIDTTASQTIAAFWAARWNTNGENDEVESWMRLIAGGIFAFSRAPTAELEKVAIPYIDSLHLAGVHFLGKPIDDRLKAIDYLSGAPVSYQLLRDFAVPALKLVARSTELVALLALTSAAMLDWFEDAAKSKGTTLESDEAIQKLYALLPADTVTPGLSATFFAGKGKAEVRFALSAGLALAAGKIPGVALGTELVSRLGIDIPAVVNEILTSPNWLSSLMRTVAQGAQRLGADFGSLVVQLGAGLFALAKQVANGTAGTSDATAAFLGDVADELGSAIRAAAASAANAVAEFVKPYSDALFSWGASISLPDFYGVIEQFRNAALASGFIGEASAATPENVLGEALEIALERLELAGQRIVIRAGAGTNPNDGVAIDPDMLPSGSSGVAEGHARLFTLYLPYEAGESGQHVNLQLEGAEAPTLKAIIDGQVIDLPGGEFDLLVAEGQRQVSFGLWSRDDVDSAATLSLKAHLVDASGNATHVEHIELELSLTAVDEQPFTIPGAVVTDPEPQNPEIYGTDADEQILGKDTKDIVYPLIGADLVRTGAGDDSVLVYFSSGGDTAGDWVDLGEGNDFAVRWAGEDTLIGGPGADVMLAGADADRLFAEVEINLTDAIALGETQGAGGAGDLLDGWTGDDVAIGWGGADGLLGGDGEDVLVGMGGDDNIFGDWQFSQYTSASADWRVERETTWVTPDRRKVTARLVSVLTTEASVAGGADTIFGGAGADWLLGQAGDDFIDGGRDDDVIFGDEGADALYGRDGADILSGDDLDDGTAEGLAGALHGADTLDGGAGDDELSGNGDDDQLYGGDGDDTLGGDDPVTPGGFHGKDYLAGGAGNDKLWGEGNDDWLVGGDGDDHLEGDYTDLEGRFHGADHLDGGAGADELIGQGGADELYGREGDDTLAGDNANDETIDAAFHGDDFIDGGAGNDSLKGGGGKDRLFGGDGQDSLVGDGGVVEDDDELHGGADGDTLEGNRGMDRLYGDAGQDYLDGGAGADLLQGGADLDRLEGGSGEDIYVLHAGDSPAGGALESIADSDGRDTVRLVGASVRSVRQNGDTTDLVLSFGGSDEVLIEGGFAGSIELFDVGDGLVLSWQELMGRYLDESQNRLSSDAGAMLAGGSGADTLAANGGGATLSGGHGDDVLVGSGGSNTYLYSFGDGTDTIRDTGGLPTEPNRIVFGAGITPDDLWLSTGSLRIDVGWDPRDRILIPTFDPDDVLAQRAIDLFEFADGTTLTYQQLIARGFDIDGTDAADTLRGTNVVDRIYGGAGDDTLETGAGDDVLDGGLGNDTLTGGDGNDVYLFGYGDGQDTLADGASGDSDALALFAGVGSADVELERFANDLVVKLRSALDQVTVRDQFAGDGVDRLAFADGSFWDRIEIAARIPNRLTEGPDTYTGSAYADTIYGRGGADRLFGQAGADLIDGGDGADELQGGDGDDRLLGQEDADWISAGKGADTLEGGAGADVLYGEDDDDVLIGGPGDDTLSGGAGSDTYRFAPGDGRDTIDNYDSSANRVDVLAFWASDSTEVALRRVWSVDSPTDELYFDLLDPAGKPTGEWVKLLAPFLAADSLRMLDRVEFADGVQWTGAEIRASLTAATSGADTFRGFGSADALDGGAGDDYIAGADGGDTILGGTGADRLWGEIGDDILDGGAGDDVLSGDYTYPSSWLYEGRDVLRGGDGADLLDGGGGADILEGGPGADRLLGGEGDDLYVYTRGDGADEITDKPFYSNGPGGNDTLRFAMGITPADFELFRTRSAGMFASGDDLTLVIDGSRSQIRITSYFAAGREIETIEFGDGTRWRRADVDARLRTGPADTLTGTAGDDTFLVDNEGDIVVEPLGGGIDTIESIVSYLLPANVEQLTLTGALNASATGNDLDNTLRGNANDNRLEGGQGMDTVIGGLGDDVYVDTDPYIDGHFTTYTPDTIVEAVGEGYDTVEAKAYDYTLPENVERLVLLLTPEYSFYDSRVGWYVAAPRHGTGNALDNVIDASRAQSGSTVVLDGVAGADAYIGHWGKDTYRLTDPGDRILATGDATQFDTYLVDAVESAFDFDLAGLGLTLTLIGDATVSGWGNGAANILDGSQNPAANALTGGRGDDRYVLGANDVAIEQAREGRDTVQIAKGLAGEYRLGDYAYVEALELSELTGASWLVGTAGNDALTGNRFANRLDGGAGSDALTGGDGSDSYVTGRALGRRHEVTQIDEDRVSDDDKQALYYTTVDTIILEGLQDDLQTPVRAGYDLVIEQVRRDPTDPANDLLFESVRVANYFAGARYQVEQLQFGDGTTLDLARLAAAGVRVPGSAVSSTTLTGYLGPDELVATEAASSLYGGYGDDVLRGGSANDFIAGEGGNDRMLGGMGNDRYSFGAGFGRDYIDDAGGDDSLEFAGLASSNAIVRVSGDRLELAFASGDSVVVRQKLAQDISIERAYFSGDNVWLDAAALAARSVGPIGNLAPFVNAASRDRAVLEDQPFALVLGTDTFVELDAGDTLTYALTGSYGASLPAWLAFDAQTLTLSGAPGNGDVGTTSLDFTATDGSGARASWTMQLVVNNVNDAPVATPPAVQTAFGGQSYVLAVLPEVFSDPDAGDLLTVTGSLAGGDALPDWLLLDGGPGWSELSASPTAADLGRYVIELVVTDGSGATASASVTLDVVRENHAPVVAAALPNQTVSEDTVWSYGVPAATFLDPDADDTLAYVATLVGGGALPVWLTFDPAARRFSGTPGNENVGSIAIAVTATDTAGAKASDAFDLKVNNINDAPQLLRSSDATSVEEGQPLVYLANAAFTDVDAGDALTYSAKLANGSTLPSWLTINATTGRLSGTSAIGALGVTDVRVTAKDKAGATAILPVLVAVVAAPPRNLVGTSSNNTLTGKSGDDRLDGKGGADTMRGGLGNDTYVVDNTGDSVVENASAGADLVESSITYSVSSRPNVEHIVLTGTTASNATGNGASNMLRGNAANNTLSSSGGVDALQGLGGNDALSDSGGNGLLDGGSGTDSLMGNSGRQLFIGGTGNDTIATSTGADIIAFNKGDGQDTVNASSGTDNVVSLGGGISYSELFLSKSGNNLVFETGVTDRITLKDWYASTTNRSVATLQVIAEAMAGYPNPGDPLLGAKVERFDFMSLVAAFDAARAANANLTRWQMMDKLLTAHLAASDTEALGGDLAYQYGLNGAVTGIGFDTAAAIVSATQFATAPQALQPLASLQQGPHRLA